MIGNTVCGVPPAAQISGKAARSRSTTVVSGAGCPVGATPPMAWPVASRTCSGVARLMCAAAEALGERGRVDPVRPARHDQERLVVRPEHQAVGDRPDLDAEGGGRERRGGRGIRQHDDLPGIPASARRWATMRLRSGSRGKSAGSAVTSQPIGPIGAVGAFHRRPGRSARREVQHADRVPAGHLLAGDG